MNVLFTISLMLYFAATLLCFAGAAFRKEGLKKAALLVLLIAVAAHLIYVVWRGIAAHRLPLANQFEFATMFALMVAIFCGNAQHIGTPQTFCHCAEETIDGIHTLAEDDKFLALVLVGVEQLSLQHIDKQFQLGVIFYCIPIVA